MAFLLSICSLCFASLNDVVFKLYARKERPRGLYVVMIGFVWGLVFAVTGWTAGGLRFDQPALVWGLASGLFGAASNLIFIRTLTHMNIGVAATIYRLNLAPAALFAFLFMGEDASPLKLLGIMAAIGAMLLFLPERSEDHPNRIARGYFWLMILASVLRAGMGVTYKIGISAGSDRNAFLVLNGLAWMLGGIGYYLTTEGRTPAHPKKTILYGLASGALVCGIVFFLAAAMQQGQASLVLPVSQLSFLGSALIGIFLMHERISRRGLVAIGLGAACIVLMALDSLF